MYSNALAASIQELATALLESINVPAVSAEALQRRREDAQRLISTAADLAAVHGNYPLQRSLYELSDAAVRRHTA